MNALSHSWDRSHPSAPKYASSIFIHISSNGHKAGIASSGRFHVNGTIGLIRARRVSHRRARAFPFTLCSIAQPV
jgi:hypothetical protein